MKIQCQKIITENKTIALFFLFVGLVSTIVMAIVIFNGVDSDDFFYINQTVDGVTSREYQPGIVILLLTIWGLASAIFSLSDSDF